MLLGEGIQVFTSSKACTSQLPGALKFIYSLSFLCRLYFPGSLPVVFHFGLASGR